MVGQCAVCVYYPPTLADCYTCVNTKIAPCNICDVIKDLPRRYVKTADPTVDDDETLGYKIADVWVNTSNSKAYFCMDASDGAAVWKQYQFV